MSNRQIIDHDPATSSSRVEDRSVEIADWDRNQGLEIARGMKLEMTDAHWQVVEFLRQRYFEQGDPESARKVARDLNRAFAEQGGDDWLRKLFPDGPVYQGSRIAELPVPPYSTDPSFGSSY